MRARDRYLGTAAASIALAVGAGLALMAVGHLVLDDPPPTVQRALERVFESFSVGPSPAATLGAYGAALLLGLLGFGLGLLWGYVLALTALVVGAAVTLNPVLAAGAYVVGRSWHHFLHQDVAAVDEPAEWSHGLVSGLLLTAVFGNLLAAHSPAARLATVEPRSAPASVERLVDARAVELRLAEERLLTIADFAAALRAVRAEFQQPYPVSEVAQSVADVSPPFAAAVQESLDRVPAEAQLAYWSNGSSFLLFAALPTPFEHPRTVAVSAPAGTVLVRTDADAHEDLDFDGLSTTAEREGGTSPVLADTDDDGYPDGTEVGTGHDPLVPPMP